MSCIHYNVDLQNISSALSNIHINILYMYTYMHNYIIYI